MSREDAPDPGVLDRLFGVLADPTRRRIVETLVHDGPRTATELAGDFTISRQAIVKHLQVLEGAGLVSHQKLGREVLYALETERLDDARVFLEGISAGWDRALERLRTLVEEPSGKRR